MGQEGVTKSLEIIHRELDVTMALCGRRDATTLDKDVLLVPKNFEGDWA